MIITIEGVDYSIPKSLSEITLWDRIEYDRQYGKDLRESLKTLIENLDEIEFSEYQADVACKTLSFYGKIPLEIVQATAIEDVLAVYENAMAELSAEVNFGADISLQTEFKWKGEDWVIAPPELKQDSKMQFGEFIDAKQSVQNMQDAGEQRWGSLLPLCCIYFRIKGEKYDKSFVNEGSHRMELMKTLPVFIALNVGFFLNSLINTFPITSRFSGLRRRSPEVSI